MNTLGCFRCQFGGKCNHLHGLYSVDIGFTYVVCNMCGHVVYHGRKKAVQEFIRQISTGFNGRSNISQVLD